VIFDSPSLFFPLLFYTSLTCPSLSLYHKTQYKSQCKMFSKMSKKMKFKHFKEKDRKVRNAVIDICVTFFSHAHTSIKYISWEEVSKWRKDEIITSLCHILCHHQVKTKIVSKRKTKDDIFVPKPIKSAIKWQSAIKWGIPASGEESV